MSTITSIQLSIYSPNTLQRPSVLSLRERSPQNTKRQLMARINTLQKKNNQLQVKQQNLHNTIYDLRKLIQMVNKEDNEIVEDLYKEIYQLQDKKQRYGAALLFGQKNEVHLQKCMMFWNQFL